MKTRVFGAVVVLVVLITNATAYRASAQQDTIRGWKAGGNFGINVTNIGLSNWLGGGQNTLAIAGLFTAFAHFRSEDSTLRWENALEFGYGQAQVGDVEFRKSDDRIIFTSKLAKRFDFTAPISASVLLDFRTQFDEGRDFAKQNSPLISRFFAPAFLVIATGFSYKFEESLSLFLSPVGGRGVFVSDPQLSAEGAFGVDKGTTSRLDLGASLNLLYKITPFENVNFQTRLNVFSPYRAFGAVAITWETLTIFKVNKFLNVSFDTQLLYEEKISRTRQLKTALAVGFVLPF
jgi:hypothetical protein